MIEANTVRLRELLHHIASGKGEFNRDTLTHAANVIDEARDVANEALMLLDTSLDKAPIIAAASQHLVDERGSELSDALALVWARSIINLINEIPGSTRE